jgi:hypothetical protein
MGRLMLVSGGQTGVDRAALDAALACGVPCGGWCPAGRRAEDGLIANIYPLTETASASYDARTLANIRDSQGTLILCPFGAADRIAQTSAGTHLTLLGVQNSGRPLFVAELALAGQDQASVERIIRWIRDNRIFVLNVAGPRESESQGIHARAYGLITTLLATIQKSSDR